MSGADRLFVGGAAALTLVVPGALVLASPFAEPHAAFGLACGWGLALAIMLPSWVLVSRGAARPDSLGFLRGFMAGTLLRLALTVAAVTAFTMLQDQPAVKSFLTSFFLGYMLLMGLELLALRGVRRSRAESQGREASA